MIGQGQHQARHREPRLAGERGDRPGMGAAGGPGRVALAAHPQFKDQIALPVIAADQHGHPPAARLAPGSQNAGAGKMRAHPRRAMQGPQSGIFCAGEKAAMGQP